MHVSYTADQKYGVGKILFKKVSPELHLFDHLIDQLCCLLFFWKLWLFSLFRIL